MNYFEFILILCMTYFRSISFQNRVSNPTHSVFIGFVKLLKRIIDFILYQPTIIKGDRTNYKPTWINNYYLGNYLVRLNDVIFVVVSLMS